MKENLEQVRALPTRNVAGENKSDLDAEASAAARAASGSVLRVLMVDDSLADCELIKHHLKSCGYTALVERVACEETMRHALGWGHWDIVFTDDALPRFSGLDALALLRKMGSQIPVLSITGNADPKITEQMLEAGAHACINKNDLSTLCAAVEGALSASSSRRATHDLIKQKEAQRAQADLETQLRQAQKLEALGTFAAGIAHDFNNLLTVIIAYTELASAEADKPEQTRSHLEEVRKASEHAQSLVQQLLTFSRQQKQERKPIRLQSVVQEALRFLRSTLPATVEITSKIDAAAPVVLADPTQIHQVIMNLCTNSAHAMRGQSGHLSVTLRSCEVDQHLAESLHRLRPGNYVRLTVSDTGHGMDAATLKHIYEPFFTTKDPGEGTGLGLSVVHGIIREHEGVIAVESQPETGTTFDIYFPAHPTAAAETAEVPEARPSGHGEHILVVDDDPAICGLMEILLKRLGYRMTAHTNPEEALSQFSMSPDEFALVITNLRMPRMTGLELAHQIFRQRPKMPVILATGFSGEWTLEKVRALGVRDLIAKPMTITTLAIAIHNALFSTQNEE